jgi:bifunctional N-acetylglucosamine-1-phosphate-uridyltransferase/glucosamine-1-phosphate-acetyltransferase GlmU-like protein
MQACSEYEVNWIHQAERLGTGHAVMQAMPNIAVTNDCSKRRTARPVDDGTG